MKNSILALKIMTLNSSILSLVISPKLLEFCQDIPIALTALLGSVYSVFILNPFLIHILAKRYVLSMSIDKNDKLSYQIFRFIPPFTKTCYFTLNDVKIPKLSSIFTSVIIHGKSLLVTHENFLDKSFYNRLMKYDLPIDLLMENKRN
ncbi:unnamed protein product [Gordionus sp. m RMFG-2023]